jgi:hypothetical protein
MPRCYVRRFSVPRVCAPVRGGAGRPPSDPRPPGGSRLSTGTAWVRSRIPVRELVSSVPVNTLRCPRTNAQLAELDRVVQGYLSRRGPKAESMTSPMAACRTRQTLCPARAQPSASPMCFLSGVAPKTGQDRVDGLGRQRVGVIVLRFAALIGRSACSANLPAGPSRQSAWAEHPACRPGNGHGGYGVHDPMAGSGEGGQRLTEADRRCEHVVGVVGGEREDLDPCVGEWAQPSRRRRDSVALARYLRHVRGRPIERDSVWPGVVAHGTREIQR